MNNIELFENYLRFEKQSAQLSIVAYMRDLKQFQNYLGEIEIVEAKKNDIRSYVVLMVEKGDAPKSINRRIAALRSFFKFALIKNIVKNDPSEMIEDVKQPKTIPSFVPQMQLSNAIESINVDLYDDLLRFTILYMLYATGLRRSELAGLKNEDVNLIENTIKVLGKGGKTRLVPIADQLNEVIKNYCERKNQLAIENCCDNVCLSRNYSLFLSHKLKPISDYQIYSIIKKTVKEFGFTSDVSPHTLRHTFATHLMNQNVNIRTIQQLLGHASLATTQIYTHTSVEELKKTFINAHPRGKK